MVLLGERGSRADGCRPAQAADVWHSRSCTCVAVTFEQSFRMKLRRRDLALSICTISGSSCVALKSVETQSARRLGGCNPMRRLESHMSWVGDTLYALDPSAETKMAQAL